VPLAPDRVLVSKGYFGGGSLCLRLVRGPDGGLVPEEVWRNKRALRTKFTNVVVLGTHAYGLSDGFLECVDLQTGERIWRAGRYGHGQTLGVGELLLVLSETGELVLIEPAPDTPNAVLGRIQAVEGKTWNNLALYGDVVIVRNGVEAAAFRLALADER